MALSKVMASSSPSNPDLSSQPSSYLLHRLPNFCSSSTRIFGPTKMEDILNNMYSDSDSLAAEQDLSKRVRNGSGEKTADEVWRDIVGGSGRSGEKMTLEVFLAKAGVVNEEEIRVSEEVKVSRLPPPYGPVGSEAEMTSPITGVPAAQFAPVLRLQNGVAVGGFGMEFVNGMVSVSGGDGDGGGYRGKRRIAEEEVPVDKATQQKQRRMIKNRESAARSRERKQAYTVELESLVTHLEEENAMLLKEEAELNEERYKRLMENIIPVLEKRLPRRALRRVHSMSW